MTVLRKLKALWMAFSHVLGQVQTTLLLSIIYHVAIGPLGLMARIVGRDLLGLRRLGGDSYAAPLPPISATLERAQRQF
jgi:hypothetical protein